MITTKSDPLHAIAEEAGSRLRVAIHMLRYFQDPDPCARIKTEGHEWQMLEEILRDVADTLNTAALETHKRPVVRAPVMELDPSRDQQQLSN